MRGEWKAMPKRNVRKAAPKVGKAMPKRGGLTGSAKPSGSKPMKRSTPAKRRGVPRSPGSGNKKGYQS